MNKEQWNAFVEYRESIKSMVTDFSNSCYKNELRELQEIVIEKNPSHYSLENQLVYNTAYDEITEENNIKKIIVGDNPGKDEQLNRNRKYLVGQAGKLGETFFIKNPELAVDLRKDVIITNKTLVHTPKTKDLIYIEKNASQELKNELKVIQVKMADLTYELHKKLNEKQTNGSLGCELWLVGYGELKNNGVFTEYKQQLFNNYKTNDSLWNKVFVYQHFSMNRFSIDLSEYRNKHTTDSLKECLENLGKKHKIKIFETNER